MQEKQTPGRRSRRLKEAQSQIMDLKVTNGALMCEVVSLRGQIEALGKLLGDTQEREHFFLHAEEDGPGMVKVQLHTVHGYNLEYRVSAGLVDDRTAMMHLIMRLVSEFLGKNDMLCRIASGLLYRLRASRVDPITEGQDPDVLPGWMRSPLDEGRP